MSSSAAIRAAAVPRALTIAGSDSGGGAGIQADLKTFTVHGVYGASAITAVTAQNTRTVSAVHAIPPAVVGAQIEAVVCDLGVDAVKIGMLAVAGIVVQVAERLEQHRLPRVVLDPVMVSKSGAALLADDAVAVLRDRLWPRVDLITPNLPEALRLAAAPADRPWDETARRELALELAERGPAVLLKGGHADDGEELVDLLASAGEIHRFAHRRLATSSTHGTGCTLSAAIAARLARGETMLGAVAGAVDYVHQAIAHAVPLGSGHGPVNHLHGHVFSSERTNG